MSVTTTRFIEYKNTRNIEPYHETQRRTLKISPTQVHKREPSITLLLPSPLLQRLSEMNVDFALQKIWHWYYFSYMKEVTFCFFSCDAQTCSLHLDQSCFAFFWAILICMLPFDHHYQMQRVPFSPFCTVFHMHCTVTVPSIWSTRESISIK